MKRLVRIEISKAEIKKEIYNQLCDRLGLDKNIYKN